MNRMNVYGLILLSVVVASCSTRNEPADEHADHGEAVASPAAIAADVAGSDAADVATGSSLPAGANEAVQRLADSPRHGEWAMVRTGPNDSIRAWVVYPERSTAAPVVLVVHEILGLTNWIRAVADQLAADGFIAIAPDLMTSHAIPAEASGDPVRDQATTIIRTLDPAAYHAQLAALGAWGLALPAASDSYGIVGFCWGGTASFQHAISAPGVSAAVVYYGTSPQTTDLARVGAPVLGLYAGDDARVNATVPAADSALAALGKPFEHYTFEGAGHGFLRQQDGRDGANLAATRRAWPLTLQFFRRHLQ